MICRTRHGKPKIFSIQIVWRNTKTRFSFIHLITETTSYRKYRVFHRYLRRGKIDLIVVDEFICEIFSDAYIYIIIVITMRLSLSSRNTPALVTTHGIFFSTLDEPPFFFHPFFFCGTEHDINHALGFKWPPKGDTRFVKFVRSCFHRPPSRPSYRNSGTAERRSYPLKIGYFHNNEIYLSLKTTSHSRRAIRSVSKVGRPGRRLGG